MSLKKLFLGIFVFSFIGVLIFVFAANYYELPSGETKYICEHSVNKKVKNDGSDNLFVPTKSSDEWQAFIDNSGLSISSIGCCDEGDCSSSKPFCISYYCKECKVDDDCGGGNWECTSSNSCTCTPSTQCATGVCGTVSDGCGGSFDCEPCGPCQKCSVNSCVNACKTGEVCYNSVCCKPSTCGTDDCGSISDGCGGTINCGECPFDCGSCEYGCNSDETGCQSLADFCTEFCKNDDDPAACKTSCMLV